MHRDDYQTRKTTISHLIRALDFLFYFTAIPKPDVWRGILDKLQKNAPSTLTIILMSHCVLGVLLQKYPRVPVSAWYLYFFLPKAYVSILSSKSYWLYQPFGSFVSDSRTNIQKWTDRLICFV